MTACHRVFGDPTRMLRIDGTVFANGGGGGEGGNATTAGSGGSPKTAGAPAPGGSNTSGGNGGAGGYRDVPPVVGMTGSASCGITHTPFVVGGGDSDDLILDGWPPGALHFHLATAAGGGGGGAVGVI